MTQQEAEDQFISAKKNYYEAEQRRAQLSNQMDNYRAEKKYAAEQISSARGERTNFEKRLRGIESIIKMLEGTGWSSKNAPQSIDKANSALQSANSNYQQCIRLSGGVSAADNGAYASETFPTVAGRASKSPRSQKNGRMGTGNFHSAYLPFVFQRSYPSYANV